MIGRPSNSEMLLSYRRAKVTRGHRAGRGSGGVSGFKRKPLAEDDLTQALKASTGHLPAVVGQGRGKLPKTVQVNFNASEMLARLIAQEAAKVGGTRRLVARLLRQAGHEVRKRILIRRIIAVGGVSLEASREGRVETDVGSGGSSVHSCGAPVAQPVGLVRPIKGNSQRRRWLRLCLMVPRCASWGCARVIGRNKTCGGRIRSANNVGDWAECPDCGAEAPGCSRRNGFGWIFARQHRRRPRG